MTITTSQQIQVSLPGAGKTQTYRIEADTPVKFDFDLADAVFSGIDGNLGITVEGGGTVVLENYQALADAGSLPLFEMASGEQVAGDVYIYAFDGVDRNADMETAAGNANTGSGAGQYSDDPGTLVAGIEALDGQGDAFDGSALSSEEDVLGDTDDALAGAAVAPVILISGDDEGSVTEDLNVGKTGLLTDSGQLLASDVNETFIAQDIIDPQGGTFSILADGSWTYRIDNDSVQKLGEVEGVNNEFSNDFTISSASGVEHTVTVTVNGENDAPEGSDFTVTGDFGAPVDIDFDVAPITDVEDDAGTGDGLDTGVVITSLPEHGTLYYNETEVTQEDIDSGTRFDDLDNFHYVSGDAPATNGVLLGSRLAEDAGLNTWGERVDGATRQLSVDTDGEGGADVTITTHISSGNLKVYNGQQAHIDHGLANASHNGIDRGEILTITFEGKDVAHAEIGFGGLGGYFHANARQGAQATWTAYDDGEVVASGTVNTTVMTWHNHVTGESGTITGGDGDIFQSLTLDQSILDGQSFDKIEFGTSEATARNWFSNWELQYMDVEFAGDDSFTYRPVDSEGLVNDGDPYTVTVTMLPGPGNEDPAAVNDAASIHEPNTDGLDYTVSANVLTNDVDADNTPGEMSLTQITFGDTTVNFVDHTISGDAAAFNGDGTVTFQGAHGTLTIGANGAYTYTATDNTLVPGDAPTETFTYTMTDGDTVDNDPAAQTADLVITVHGLNDAPVAADDAATVLEDGLVSGNVINGAGTDHAGQDTDIDGDSLTVTQFVIDGSTYEAGQTADMDGVGKLTIDADGDYSFIPAADYDGDVPTATYTVTDGNGGFDTADLAIDITPVNDAPVAADDAATVLEDSSVSGNVINGAGTDHAGQDTDIDGDSLTVTQFVIDGSTYEAGQTADMDGVGKLTIDADGTYSFIPAADYDGDVPTATYTVTDGNGGFDTADLAIDITPVNDAPVAADDAATVLEDSSVSGNVINGAGTEFAGQDTDIDGGALTVTQFVIDGSTYAAGQTADMDGVGKLTIDANGDYSFIPAADYDGDVPTATYTVTDGNGGFDTADLAIDITPVNDAPTIDLSMGTVNFVSENAGYNNMVGVYQLDENGDPINPEIILQNSNLASQGDLLTTFEDGEAPHYFLVDVRNGSTPQGTPVFSQNASGQWEVSFDGGATTYAVRFDDASLNNDPEDTFRIENLTDGRLISLDDQLVEGYKTAGDDDDYNDTVLQEHASPDTSFENTFVEDGGPVRISGEVNISDVDSTHMAQAVISLTSDYDGDSLNIDTNALPDGITATISGNKIVLSGDAPVASYESAIEMITFNNDSDDPNTSDRLIEVQVWDDAATPVGDPSNIAVATIHVIAVDDNTPPTAVDDTGSGSGWITGDGGEAGVISGSTNYSLAAEQYDADSGEWVSAILTHKGSGNGAQYGVQSPGDTTGHDINSIENDGHLERLLIEFDDPQQSVSFKLTGDGRSQESIKAWDADGNEITDLRIDMPTDDITISSPTATISTVVIMADTDLANSSVVLKGTVSSVPAEHSSGDFEAAVITGNVLANDHDAQDTDYTDGPGFPGGSTALTVTGAATGDLDNLTQSEYDQHLANGDFDPDSGTFDLDDGVGATIHGQFGDLVIAEDGSYTYTTHDGLAAGDYTESFTYQVSDTEGAVDYGVIDVSATIAEPTLTANMDLGPAAVVDPAATEIAAGETHHLDFTFSFHSDRWQTMDDVVGLKVSGENSVGGSAELINSGDGLGLSSSAPDGYTDTNSSEISHGVFQDGDATESLILDFGHYGVKEPLNVAIALNGVSDGESVIFTVTDTLGNTYTFDTSTAADGSLITDANGSGVTLFKANALEYEIRGSMAGYDESNVKLIDTITITPGANSAFRLYSMDVTGEGTWEPALQPASGFLLANDYSSDNAAMEAAIVGSGVGQWGTLEITDASTGAWVYTPNEDAVLDPDTGLHAPTVEQFTYQVTDAHGLIDTATLYVPVQYGSVQSDHGTTANDLIHGTSGDDTITGLDGSDMLFGEAGNDHLDGGSGNDYIDAGSGNDHLYGGSGNDHLFGGAGDDTIDAGTGDDTVYFGGGHDSVTLGAGADTITIDPNYLADGNSDSLDVLDFNIGEGDRIDLSTLHGGTVEITSDGTSDDLILSIDGADIGGDDITITLHGVLPPSHDAFDHQVDLDAGDDLNAVIQHIISSGGHDS
ncbi:Ig-like domain-containing protein [Pseudodesulfovibrio thermohalotolerans]|uniref:Ig-like domain-containing protein n=1 Tax=Pseudodesulfovibrio thermohalotolerans TaxID=2880651 RepID=UPI0024427D36|nr:Ig-like domain-containing protein [Pseudodesulfovibrio thermohalotolerans]WFS61728.1 Ig-like domain-containing protein [Pseudodesulfovibrio thermohalotolerans]